jgi:hypothetical protein
MTYTPEAFCGGLIRFRKDRSAFRYRDRVYRCREESNAIPMPVSAFGDLQVGIAAEDADQDATTVLVSLGDLPDPQKGKWTTGLPQELDVAIQDVIAHISRAYHAGIFGCATLEIHVDNGRLTFLETDLSRRKGTPRPLSPSSHPPEIRT